MDARTLSNTLLLILLGLDHITLGCDDHLESHVKADGAVLGIELSTESVEKVCAEARYYWDMGPEKGLPALMAAFADITLATAPPLTTNTVGKA